MGERALQELMSDNLLKFNYFLIDVRGRNLKSYMKIPIPPINDPAYEELVKNLLKHDINIEEYRSVYQNSSIPSNNNLSQLTLGIFERNSSFITQYPKYQAQLSIVVEKLLQNRFIQQIEDGNFVVRNQDLFTQKFHEIENLITGVRPRHVPTKRQLAGSKTPPVNDQPTSVALRVAITTTEINMCGDATEETRGSQHHTSVGNSGDEQGINITNENIVQLISFLHISFRLS